MLKLTDPLMVLAATAVGGSVTDVVTSASGEIAVVDDALSASALPPWLVVVWMLLDAVTVPLGGAVNVTPMLSAEPLPRLPGIPLYVTAPLAGSYVAIAPAGSPLKLTPLSPGGRPRVNVVPAAVDGPLLL